MYFFLISINFKFSKTLTYIKKIKSLVKFKDQNITKDNNDLINASKTPEPVENKRVQESLPFDEKIKANLKKFVLPDLKLLKTPLKNEKIAKKK